MSREIFHQLKIVLNRWVHSLHAVNQFASQLLLHILGNSMQIARFFRNQMQRNVVDFFHWKGDACCFGNPLQDIGRNSAFIRFIQQQTLLLKMLNLKPFFDAANG